MPGRRDARRADWDTEVSSSYAVAAFLAAAFVGFTILVDGPLVGLDATLNIRNPPEPLVPMLHVLDWVGARLVACPVLVLVVLWIHRRTGRIRPLVVSLVAVPGMVFVVGVLKLSFGRGQPGTFESGFRFLSGSLAYPSGHTANVALIYGLVPYLVTTYVGVRPVVTRWLVGAVCLFSLWMVSVSVALSRHWFADLWAGLMVGGMCLALTAAADHAIPRDVFADGLWPGLRRIPSLLVGRDVVPGPSRAPAPRSAGAPRR